MTSNFSIRWSKRPKSSADTWKNIMAPTTGLYSTLLISSSRSRLNRMKMAHPTAQEVRIKPSKTANRGVTGPKSESANTSATVASSNT